MRIRNSDFKNAKKKKIEKIREANGETSKTVFPLFLKGVFQSSLKLSKRQCSQTTLIPLQRPFLYISLSHASKVHQGKIIQFVIVFWPTWYSAPFKFYVIFRNSFQPRLVRPWKSIVQGCLDAPNKKLTVGRVGTTDRSVVQSISR